MRYMSVCAGIDAASVAWNPLGWQAAIRAIELAPQYVDVAVRRWQQFTGRQAIRESDGKPFDECRN